MRQKGFTPIIILFVILAFGAIGYFFYTHLYLLSGRNLSSDIITGLPITTVEKYPTIAENWKSYINPSCRFEVDYPSDWELKTSCYRDEYVDVDCLTSSDFKGNIVVPNDEVYQGEGLTFNCINAHNNTNNQMLEDCLSDKQKSSDINSLCQKVIFGEAEFIQTRISSLYSINNGKLLTIIVLSKTQSELIPLVRQILSTFKFTK